MAPRDERDTPTWVVLELSESGERLAEDGALTAHLQSILDCDRDHPIFVPYTIITRHGRKSVINVIEGYAFVASGLPDTSYLNLPVISPHIRNVLHTRGANRIRTLSTVPDRSVVDLRNRLRKMISKEIEIGSDVRVYDGLHRGLVGRVVDVHGDDAYVFIRMRTIETVRVFPRYSLRPADGILGFDSPSDVYPNYSDIPED